MYEIKNCKNISQYQILFFIYCQLSIRKCKQKQNYINIINIFNLMDSTPELFAFKNINNANEVEFVNAFSKINFINFKSKLQGNYRLGDNLKNIRNVSKILEKSQNQGLKTQYSMIPRRVQTETVNSISPEKKPIVEKQIKTKKYQRSNFVVKSNQQITIINQDLQNKQENKNLVIYRSVHKSIKRQKKEENQKSSTKKISTLLKKSHKVQSINKLSKLPNLNTICMMETKNLAKLQIKINRPILILDKKQLNHIRAQSYVVLQYPANQLVVANNAHIKVQIASLTKIMTFHVVQKLAQAFNINVQEQKIEIKYYVQEITGTVAELFEGEIYTIENLLYGLMLPSGNDAAICLAVWGGKLITKKNNKTQNIKNFIQQMNKSARQLGLLNTNFQNPHGLPHPNNRSTAFDVAKLISICMKKSQLFSKIINTKQYSTIVKSIDNSQRVVTWQNTNKLLRRQGFIGVKTGITVTAGPCLASGYNFRNKIYVTVLLRTNKISRRFKQTRKLLYWTLTKLYDLSNQQKIQLELLKKNRKQFDSDYSQDQQQFIYGNESSREYDKRVKILRYQL